MFSPDDRRMLSYIPKPPSVDHRRWKPSIEIAPNCPRCDSSNTKFCYYNNYSLTQPRYFCKGCRRYWTKGGSLRNVPVGGGCRKNRRGKPNSRLATDSITTSTSIDNTPSLNLRPDQALDDMFHNYHHTSNIDMAVMYARYLNQIPETSQAVGQTEEGNMGSGFGFVADHQEHVGLEGEAFSMNWGMENEINVVRGEEEIGSGHHFQELCIGDWSAMEQSGFEAF